MTSYEHRRNFLDRTGASVTCRAGAWRASVGAGRIAERASTAHAAVDALRATITGPLMRTPIAPQRWLQPR